MARTQRVWGSSREILMLWRQVGAPTLFVRPAARGTRDLIVQCRELIVEEADLGLDRTARSGQLVDHLLAAVFEVGVHKGLCPMLSSPTLLRGIGEGHYLGVWIGA